MITTGDCVGNVGRSDETLDAKAVVEQLYVTISRL